MSTPVDIQALNYLFSFNWKDGFVVSSSFANQIQSSYTASEQRWGCRAVPGRSISISLTGAGNTNSFTLHTYLMRISQSRHYIPFDCDETILEANTAINGQTLTCDTSMRRITSGHKIVIGYRKGTTFDNWEVVTVDTVTPTSITTIEPLQKTHQSGSKIIPLMLCEPISVTNKQVFNDNVSSVTFDALEVAGSTQIDCFDSTDGKGTLNTVPAGMTAGLNGYPIMPLIYDYARGNLSWGTDRLVESEDSGFTSSFDLIGDRARNTFSFTIPCVGRQMAYDAIRFFESRGGRLHPFWTISPQTFFDNVNVVSDTQIQVTHAVDSTDWDFYPYIGIVLNDGSMFIREVTVTSNNPAGKDTLSFDAVSGLINNSLFKAAPAWLCRLASDNMEEHWYTDNAMQCTFTVQEVLQESDKELDGLLLKKTKGIGLPWRAGLCAGDVYEEPLDTLPDDWEEKYLEGDDPEGGDNPPEPPDPCSCPWGDDPTGWKIKYACTSVAMQGDMSLSTTAVDCNTIADLSTYYREEVTSTSNEMTQSSPYTWSGTISSTRKTKWSYEDDETTESYDPYPSSFTWNPITCRWSSSYGVFTAGDDGTWITLYDVFTNTQICETDTRVTKYLDCSGKLNTERIQRNYSTDGTYYDMGPTDAYLKIDITLTFIPPSP